MTASPALAGRTPRQGLARRGLCLVIAAPSGAGKSTVASALLADSSLTASISVTTRAPRPGERDGVHYHFRDQTTFDAMAASGGLLEWATVFGRSYGSPRAPVEAALATGRDVVFDIDWQGFRQMRAALPGDVVGVFLLPPSLDALAARLARRSGDSPEEIARRMRAARDEISHWRDFDHVVVNDDLDRCIAKVRSVLEAARCATTRLQDVARFVETL